MFPVTIKVATVVALVESAVMERVIRRVGGKGSTCASFDVGKGSTCASFDVDGVEAALLLELTDVESSLLKVTFLLSFLCLK